MTKNYVLNPIYNDENECINDTLSIGAISLSPTLQSHKSINDISNLNIFFVEKRHSKGIDVTHNARNLFANIVR